MALQYRYLQKIRSGDADDDENVQVQQNSTKTKRAASSSSTPRNNISNIKKPQAQSSRLSTMMGVDDHSTDGYSGFWQAAAPSPTREQQALNIIVSKNKISSSSISVEDHSSVSSSLPIPGQHEQRPHAGPRERLNAAAVQGVADRDNRNNSQSPRVSSSSNSPSLSSSKKNTKKNSKEKYEIVTRPLEVVVGDRAVFTPKRPATVEHNHNSSSHEQKQETFSAGPRNNPDRYNNTIDHDDNSATISKQYTPPLPGGVYVAKDPNENFKRQPFPIAVVMNDDYYTNTSTGKKAPRQRAGDEYDEAGNLRSYDNNSNNKFLSPSQRVRQEIIQERTNSLADGSKKNSSVFRSRSPRFTSGNSSNNSPSSSTMRKSTTPTSASSKRTSTPMVYDRLSYIKPLTCRNDDFYNPKPGMGDVIIGKSSTMKRSKTPPAGTKKSSSSSSFRSLVPRFAPAVSHGSGLIAPKLK